MNNKERILCSAIIFNGRLVSGYRHSDCYELLESLIPDLKLPKSVPHGFLTSHKRYVDREEGYRIAKENGQLLLVAKTEDENEILTSEDLYFDPTDFFGLTKKTYP